MVLVIVTVIVIVKVMETLSGLLSSWWVRYVPKYIIAPKYIISTLYTYFKASQSVLSTFLP